MITDGKPSDLIKKVVAIKHQSKALFQKMVDEEKIPHGSRPRLPDTRPLRDSDNHQPKLVVISIRHQ